MRKHISVTSITIPDSAKSIGKYALYKCSSLKNVTFENTTGWKVSKNSNMSNSRSVDVSNTSTAAKYLRSTYDYYYWKRS